MVKRVLSAAAPSGAPLVDVFGVTRPLDGNLDGLAAFDIGAHEYVPEPSTLLLLGIGAVGLLAYAWRRRRA